MKLKHKISIVVALCFIAIWVVISVLNIKVISPIMSAMFAVGVSLLFTSLFKHLKYGEGVEQDERTKKVMYRAFAGSWFAVLLLIAVMMLADYIGVLKVNVQGALSLIFFGMIITFSGLSWYFGRKGDVE